MAQRIEKGDLAQSLFVYFLHSVVALCYQRAAVGNGSGELLQVRFKTMDGKGG